MKRVFDQLVKGIAALSWRRAQRPSRPVREEGAAFDALTRALADEVPRREALRRVGLGLATALLASLGLETAVATGRRCPWGQTRCGTNCVSLISSESHCGACNRACPSGTVCFWGSCIRSSGGSTCPSGQTRCSGKCVNLKTDASNCGVCGTGCASGAVCCNGVCCATGVACCNNVCCSQGQTCCPGTGGPAFCATLDTTTNCGACGVACRSGQICGGGTTCCFPNGTVDPLDTGQGTQCCGFGGVFEGDDFICTGLGAGALCTFDEQCTATCGSDGRCT